MSTSKCMKYGIDQSDQSIGSNRTDRLIGMFIVFVVLVTYWLEYNIDFFISLLTLHSLLSFVWRKFFHTVRVGRVLISFFLSSLNFFLTDWKVSLYFFLFYTLKKVKISQIFSFLFAVLLNFWIFFLNSSKFFKYVSGRLSFSFFHGEKFQ